MKSRPPGFSQRGTAIVVVLLFVVLLTVLALAFFMKATAFRGLSQSAVADFKSDTLARSALALTVADLREEIANGSTAFTYGNHRVFLPTASTNMIPRRSGNPPPDANGDDPVPNLVRRSVRSDSITAPGVPSRASAASSSAPSRNGRYVSAARWNKHHLIPRDPAKFGGANALDPGTDPVADFAVPDWVYVTEKGPEVLTAGNRAVVGRYAFAVYDEGGLLDANVAGYPSNTPLKADNPEEAGKVWGFGNKGGLFAADLTVLGLTQTQVDQLVGWRTFASSQPAGSFPGLTYDTAAALRYFGAVHPHVFDFLKVSDKNVGGRTDQAFATRQQLIRFGNQIGMPPDAFQYLGTFSRALEQPAYIPNPNRPRVQSSPGVNATVYGTGNDAHGVDREANPVDDINPPFPRVRVTNSFTRPDGSTAEIGDPLLAKRFPLSRLGKILRAATASKSESDPIYRDFGIYRSSPSQPWRYDHGDSTGILRLKDVAAAGREPDFFELLKAGINVGSLAKGSALVSANWSWQNAASYPYLQHIGHDTLVNLQLLQIGANLIDQYDSDHFPTRIHFAGDSAKEVRGVEDLAYLYRIRLRPAKGVAPVDAGVTQKGALFITPEIWNPHSTSSAGSGDRPSQFRIRAEPISASMPTTFIIPHDSPGLEDTVHIDWGDAEPVTFRNDGSLFRSPTLLTESNVPAGSQAQGGNFPEFSSGRILVGIRGATFEWLSNGKGPRDGMLGRSDLNHGPIRIVLEYSDGGAWVEYDSQFYEFVGAVNGGTPPVGGLKLPLAGDLSNIHKKGNFNWSGARTDPRTSRWGIPVSEFFYLIPPLDAVNHVYPTQWPDLSMPSFGHHFGNPDDKGFSSADSDYGNNENAPNFAARHDGFANGYWSQNTVRPQAGFFGKSDPYRGFYARDPDGIARRAMGGYASDPISGGNATNVSGLPLVTANDMSRPRLLNRPFRSVAEIGYTFRGTPWRNLDTSFPESGDAALLDIFCLDEVQDKEALVAGKVSLNTRQAPVLQALLAGSILDDNSTPSERLSTSEAGEIAKVVVDWTRSQETGKGPLVDRSGLIGRWIGTGTSAAVPSDADPDAGYRGVSLMVGSAHGIVSTPKAFIPALRDSWVRALIDGGETRVWNLLIDLVAQSGRFSREGASLDDFHVEGEKRFWLHLAIDRLTGEVLDSQLEQVSE